MQEENNFQAETNETNDSNEASVTTDNAVPVTKQYVDASAAPDQEPAQQAEDAAATEDNTESVEENETPDWFMKDKYKTVEDQAKAYSELMKQVGKNWGAPKDDYSVEGIEGVTKDDPLISNLVPALKEIGLSQEGFNSLVKNYQEANKKMVEKFEAELKEELTVKDAHTYQSVNKWMQETLRPEEIEQVKNNWLMTPADFKVFNALRLMAAPSTNVPSSKDGDNARFESSRSVENDKIKYRKELKEGLRVADKNYENELAQRFRDALQREQRAKG